MVIPGYSQYTYKDGIITNQKTKKTVTITANKKCSTGFVKLKNDEGVWKSVAVQKIQALCTPELTMPPEGYLLVPGYSRTYINKYGSVWVGPSTTKSFGQFSTEYVGSNGYAEAATEYLKNRAGRPIHQMLALTFLDSEYLEKGLCVMHLDDDKLNYSLSNLKIATYSENNKAAYETGVNPGKGV